MVARPASKGAEQASKPLSCVRGGETWLDALGT